MYGYLRKVFLLILILLFSAVFVAGESYTPYMSFHTQIYNRLRSDGYSPIRQALKNSNSTQFPYNVILHSSNPESTLSIITDTDFALNHISLIEDLSNFAEIAITVNDTSYLPEDIEDDMPAGIRTYISSLQFPSETAVLLLSTDASLSDDNCIIVPGADGKLTPYSFFKNIIDSLQEGSIPFSVKNRFLSLYRLNITEYSKKLAVCLNEGCSAIQLDISPEIKNSTLAFFVEILLSNYINTELDRNINYSFIRIGKRNIIIPEIVSTIVLVIMTGIILFFLCGLSFTFGKKKEQHKSVILAIFILLFYAAQLTALKTAANWQQHPVFMIVYKFILTCCFFRIFALLRHVIKIPCTDFIYGYLLTLTCFLNIYIFSAIDLSLLIQFALACLIAYISRMTKRTFLLIIFTLLLSAPVILYGVFSLTYIQKDALLKIIDASVGLNTLFASILLPFTFMVIRIAVSTGIPGTIPGRNKRIIIESITVVCTTLLIIAVGSIATRQMKPEPIQQKTEIAEVDGILLSTIRKVAKNDRTDFELVLSSSYPVIRYDVTADSNSTMPFYYANFPYEYSSSDGRTVFLLDENPPTPFVITGSIPPSETVSFIVSAYMHTDTELIHETKTISLSGKR